jgi:kumamolisin
MIRPIFCVFGIIASALLLATTSASASAAAPAARSFTIEAMHGRIVGSMAPQEPVKIHVLLQGRHEDELDRLIELQATPGSGAFGHYLTPEEFGRYFGADPTTYARAIALLRANGFTISDLANNRRDIVAIAPAAAVERFFSTPLDRHVERERSFYAARYMPIVPAGLHAAVVTGLNDYHVLHSHMRTRPNAVVGGNFSWAPADLATAYDLNPLYTANLTGKGITMANATAGAASASDLALFEKTFKLPAAKLVSTPIDGALSASCGSGCGNGESSLDVDSATSTARDVTFNQVVGHTAANNDFDDVYKYIVDKLGTTTHVVTTSWGGCEADQDASEQTLDNGYFKQAVAEGQWWFSAAGDNGTDDCGDGSTTAISVDFPGSSPYVISVGGTNVHATINSAGTITKYVSESVWQYGNCSETDGVSSNGAGGGGHSNSYTKPSYQTALTPKDARRDVPDVSLLSDDVNDGLFIADGGQLSGGNGGTSEAAPQWAALLAIVEQKKANYKNVVDPHVRLYQLAALSTHASYFHDVIGGNNDVPKCAQDIAVFGGYSAVAGFDRATGIGSYVGAALVNGY